MLLWYVLKAEISALLTHFNPIFFLQKPFFDYLFHKLLHLKWTKASLKAKDLERSIGIVLALPPGRSCCKPLDTPEPQTCSASWWVNAKTRDMVWVQADSRKDGHGAPRSHLRTMRQMEEAVNVSGWRTTFGNTAQKIKFPISFKVFVSILLLIVVSN